MRDSRGAMLSDVLITVLDAQGGTSRTVFTDIEGMFALREVPAGDYTVRAERIGFVPRAFTRVPVKPNRVVTISIVLEGTTNPAPALESSRFLAGALGAGDAGRSLWLGGELLRSLPLVRHELDEAARLSTRTDAALGYEGLPSALTTLAIDGFSFRTASLPFPGSVPPAATLFSLAPIDAAAVMAPHEDVEWGGAAGAIIAGFSRRPGPDTDAALDVAGAQGVEGTSFTHARGSFSLEGSFQQDSARFGIAVAARQGELPVSAMWRPTPAAAAVAAFARDQAGIELGENLTGGTVNDRAFAGSARLTMRIGRRHSLESVVAGALVPEASMAVAGPLGPRLESGTDLLAGAAVRSELGDALRNSLRLSVTRSDRETVAGDVVPTLIVSDALSFGTAAPLRATETAGQLSNALEISRGRNTLKAGAEIVWSMFEHTNQPGAAGQYMFGNVDDLIAGTGYFERTVGGATDVSWTSPRIGVFAQNRWTGPTGVDVTVGFRAEQVSLQTDAVPVDAEFLTLTGIASNTTPPAAWAVSPRLAARWDVKNEHALILHASAGVFHDRLDPSLVGAWLTDNGTAVVHQLAGATGNDLSAAPAGTRTARRVTLFDGTIRGPQSARVSLGLSRAIGANASLELSGAFRDTRYLPSVVDLNLIPAPASTDIYGRPVYGQLEQHGELVVPVPGTNRRFSSYDEVAAIRTDGRSRYWGVTLGAQMEPLSRVSVLARYTFSQTTDDLFNARTTGWLTPGPGSLPGMEDFADGRSDFDAPHRAVLAMTYEAPFGLGLSGIYRFESGLPFTPGFQTGVDINGDGFAANDPVFTDAAIPGTDALMSTWSCLKAGAFAERNSCRAASTHTIDARLRLDVLRGTGLKAAVVLDALNVLDTRIDVPDAALYIVDPAGSVSETDGTVSVPLVANPNFGRGRAGAASKRFFRLGISLDW
ncbi:MAG TPA: carboxypeptidase-like regulatory domain-containing protein [Longimicrobiales bacterium]